MSDPLGIGSAPDRAIIARDVESMSYNELIGLVRETNRPPGGLRTLEYVAQQIFLRPGQMVLEVGCATGWTSIELTALTGADITAIDLNIASIEEARRRAKATGLESIRFEVADAASIPLNDASVDVVFCGNVTSLVSDANRVAAEYSRVLKRGGRLVAMPMYYVRTPPDELVDAVRKAIQVNIPVRFKGEAVGFFENIGLEVHSVADFVFDEQPVSQVDAFCDDILERPHLQQLPAQAKRSLNRIYRDYMQLFRRNLANMGFSVVILRKPREEQEAELFHATHVSGN